MTTTIDKVKTGQQIRLLMEKRGVTVDRKSTRLNSSHTVISYAVFCLKKSRKIFSLLSAEGAVDENDVKARSEERRVGKECRSRWSPYH